MTEQSPNRLSKSIITLIILGVGASWAITPFLLKMMVGDDYTKLGQAGDMFGSVNALFSGLAFAGVIIAILLQREELSLQREELTLTRNELARSAEAQNESQKALNKTLYAQSFKVAMDIIEAPNVIQARRVVWTNLSDKRDDWKNWRDNDKPHVDLVSRTFETVGTMVRQELLPASYIIETWSVPIVRNWWIMELHLKGMRVQRNDPFIAKDFEWLEEKAAAYLIESGIDRKELLRT